MVNESRLGILTCEAGRPFANKVLEKLLEKQEKAYLIDSKETHFANSEIKTLINESIRDTDVYVFQDVENSKLPYSVNDNYLALKTAIKAAKRSQARSIIPIIPYFPYSRQDKSMAREGITAAMVAREIEDISNKIDTVVTLDVHNDAIAGFFRDANLQNLHASKQIMEYIRETFNLKDILISSADEGSVDKANHYAKNLRCALGVIYKDRNYSKSNCDDSAIEKVTFLGDCKNKDVIIIDDMICTGGTIVKNVEMLKKEKGAKSVTAACSLPLFNGPAVKRLSKAYSEGILERVIGTDAIYHGNDFQQKNPWYKEVSVAGYFAKVIKNLTKGVSISKLLE